MHHSPRQLLLLGAGCVVLGAGVALLLTADLGSDGFSTLVNGVSLRADISFWTANVLVSLAFLAVAAARRVVPGLGTVVQVVVVGGSASLLLEALTTPDGWGGRIAMLVVALPVLGVGIATYLGSRTGAGPAEAAGLAWDPPIPFKWSYSLVQGGGALGGWLLGATIGPGTVVVIVLLGPLVDLTSRLLRLDVHQTAT
ncbi:hypothetical protein [Nocardioides euryhalodurans]|uniref:Integral membrane protein n=1 Tax=Nocardioides euryhalodurans TaxID=2518370 RepID=A0A4P7GMA3_9ACTN|nr:hypothetical protein [Nocardioides euryhalodurans]QBR92994.1 hypothetical protein EXE57_12475 [Nocardioides euryhalodurans]